MLLLCFFPPLILLVIYYVYQAFLSHPYLVLIAPRLSGNMSGFCLF